ESSFALYHLADKLSLIVQQKRHRFLEICFSAVRRSLHIRPILLHGSVMQMLFRIVAENIQRLRGPNFRAFRVTRDLFCRYFPTICSRSFSFSQMLSMSSISGYISKERFTLHGFVYALGSSKVTWTSSWPKSRR